MSFVEGIIRALGSLESDRIAIHEERCISVRNRNADCLRCAQACTSQAITYSNNELTVNADSCIGCGTCATACPTCAIEMREPSDEELTRYVKSVLVSTGGHPVFACETALHAVRELAKDQRDGSIRKHHATHKLPYDASQICELACLGRLDESVLVGLAAYKAHSATLVCGMCEECVHAPGGAMVQEVVASARNLLAAFGSELPLEITQELPLRVRQSTAHSTPSSGMVSRRDFFASIKRESRQVAVAAMGETLAPAQAVASPATPVYRKVNEKGTLSQFIPSRRARIYNYLKHVGSPVTAEVQSRIVGSVSIDAQICTSCRMCAVFCPTGALIKVDEDEKYGILHRTSACVQCRLCERICPEQALVVSDSISLEHFIGKKALRYDMKRPEWTPNKPNSMYAKIHTVIGDDMEMCMF